MRDLRESQLGKVIRESGTEDEARTANDEYSKRGFQNPLIQALQNADKMFQAVPKGIQDANINGPGARLPGTVHHPGLVRTLILEARVPDLTAFI